jgi:hypothetical protein
LGLIGFNFCLQRYMQQHNEVELSALGMGMFHSLISQLLCESNIMEILCNRMYAVTAHKCYVFL